MDSSQHFGNAEECSSSESGWTMYIGSPMHNDDDGDDDGDDHSGDIKDDEKVKKNDDDSDDSMASDASSGPKHRYENGESGHGMGQFKNYENDNGSKYFSYKKKANKQMEKKREEDRRIKVDKKEEPVLMRSNNPTTSVPISTTKARKLKWMGKGK